ncbi:MAG: hypothetical protein MJY99_05700 [Fibrobacter sp.]|nr:hypothetical protein [Fibrobacter sp.]
MKNVVAFFALVFLCLFFIGCGPNQKIIYYYEDIQPVAATLPYSVNVKIVDDRANGDSLSTIPFRLSHEDVFDDTRRCLNSEEEYEDTVIVRFNSLLVDHFKMSRLFRDATLDGSDYTLQGKLRTFLGYQDFSYGSAIGASFGLIGALATSDNRTSGKITIEVKELKLLDKSGAVVKDFGNFERVYNDEYFVDAYCWYIYRHVNDALKQFNSELVEYIRSNLE